MKQVIISDTSCLIALSNIDQLRILEVLYKKLYGTTEVKNDYSKPLPDWIQLKNPKNYNNKLNLEKQLDKGEAS